MPDCTFTNSRSCGIWKVVDDWIAGGTTRATVETTYGLIQDWDTSEVTSMHSLFNYKTTFDADISEWNVAKVGSSKEHPFGSGGMAYSTFQFPLFDSLSTTCFLFLLLSPCAQILLFFCHALS